MAYLKLYREKLKHNFTFLKNMMEEGEMDWGIVSKLLCGHRTFLQEVLDLGVEEIHDSRVSNLKMVKKLAPQVQTVYIKPPAKRSIKSIVTYADVSMNTEYYTMKLLSEEAMRQDKMHKVIIMIETGDLREGVMGEDLVDFYAQVFELPNLEIVGLGTNLNCLYGVMPSQDKLIQLSLYKQIIELKFDRKIPWVSGGTSVTIPLLMNQQIPKGVNHFRIGETLYFGANLFDNSTLPGMHNDVFRLYTEIIEITEKPLVPMGEMGTNPSGETQEIDPDDYGKTSFRAILDIGLLELDPKFLILEDHMKFDIAGASSDMIVLDLGENPNEYKVGDMIPFRLEYMGVLGLMNSNYIEKRIE
ncbi:MAG TPA: amino-acid racemase [Cytophagales bacterium]|nr:amino-acid racemase [Cytophagales bacterium]HAA20042.1 amino-acid racemase [Cytophagales bacterium]HAP60107.1 amino-acid racemase [Cytophagales bacterium]